MGLKFECKVNESLSSINKLLKEWEDKKIHLNELISQRIMEIADDEGTDITEEEKEQLKKELFIKFDTIINHEINELTATKEQLKLCV